MSDALRSKISTSTLPATAVEIAMEGDSITYGVNLSTSDSWPAKFAALTGLTADNIGVSGYLLSDMVANFAARTGAHYNSTKADNEVFLLGGANDLIYNHASAAQLKAYVTNFASAAIGKGFDKVWVGTIMDGTARWYDGDALNQLHEFNSWLRANYASVGISGVVDYAAQPGLTDPTNTTYFQDGLHPTAAGASIMAATALATRLKAGISLPSTGDTAAATSAITTTTAPVEVAAIVKAPVVESAPVVKAPAEPAAVVKAPAEAAPVVTAAVETAPATKVAAATSDSASGSHLTLHVSGDLWKGGPQFTVAVDGHQVGGVYEVTADHATGARQDITIDGAFTAGAHSVSVSYVNEAKGYATYDPATGWHMNDRNLYVSGVSIGGQEFGASAVTSNNASGGCDWLDPKAAVMISNGVATFGVNVDAAHAAPATAQPAPAASTGSAATAGSVTSSDTLSFHVSSDLWQGGAQFKVAVDGHELDGVHEVTADHGAGAWQDVAVTGNFGAGVHQVSVSFVNDGHGTPVHDPATGWHMNDRNLYVGSVSTNGGEFGVGSVLANNASGGCDWLDPSAAVMVSNGTATFAVAIGDGQSPLASAAQVSAAAAALSSDTLTFRVSSDLWQGGAQFKVSVDGRALDGVYEATANHGAGAWQDVAVTGAFGAGQHVVDVTFVNDGHGTPVHDPATGWQMNDRNLYVAGVALNGHAYDASAVVANNASGGCDWLDPHAAVLVANGTASFLLS